MKQLLRALAAIAVLPALILGLRYWRSRSRHRLEAREAARPLEPNAVALPDDPDDTEARRGHRSGERQELRRRIAHGPFRPIDDRGAPTSVRTERPS
jgi:hypothetical protein